MTDLWAPFAIFAVWYLLNAWLLPKLGVST
jgi:hypothetical protein